MKYETRMKFDKHLISEEYVIDNTAYRAEFEIYPLGFCSGMAGYSKYSVGFALYEGAAEFPIGSVYIRFPMLQSSDITNEEQMVEPCTVHWREHPVPRFTPFAEREIRRVVTEFIRQRKACTILGFPVTSFSVSVGSQDRNGRGRAFPRGMVHTL
ncbi:hypothetical protein [Sphaerochaeta sp. PS]|uniref:hypothetical protein n=1 Tax=Sphaerochaeta sp. PS TaxID=3076336 RepID=UPI0028A54585|nr:hypothetical protein [Sphaerochaeta sp. PS]MDT4761113.1 hypothetical protein [Sphaerochaeta sp. PS]